MNCVKCGGQLKEGDIFCNKCGSKVRSRNGASPDIAGIYNYIMIVTYGIAVTVCFICNLAVEGTLSWFYVVLSAVALAFSVTNIPVIVKKHKPVIAGACATVSLYALLFVCNWFVGGSWLFSVAYPVTTLSLVFAWGILLVCDSRRMGWRLKSAVISLIAGVSIITVNPLCSYLLSEPVYLYDYLSPVYWPPVIIGNKIVFICCICYFAVALMLHIRNKFSETA